MRTFPKLGVAAIVCLLSFECLAADRTSAPITDVMLYPGGATVVRTVQVIPGMTQAVVTGLPAGFDLQTLRAEAGPGIVLGEIVSADAAKSEPVSAAEADLVAKIEALQDKQTVLEAEAKSAQLVIDFLGRLAGGDDAESEGRRPFAADAKSLSGLVGVMGGEAAKSFATLQRVAVQQRDIGKKIDALQRDLARVRSGAMDTRTLTIKLKAERPGAVKVSYQVANAGWKPAYRASLNSETSTLVLERQAIVSQKTGEDWTNVRLTLSTSRPTQATSGSEPRPWLLSYRPPMQMRGALMREAAMAPAPAMMKSAAPAEDEADKYAPPTFETRSMFATEFRVPAATSLPADGREVSVALARQNIAVRQYLQTTPRLEAAAYVTAEADKPEGDWPAGDMQVFRDGSYVGSRYWNLQSEDRFAIGFGQDDQVRVAVIPVKSDSATAGVFDKRRRKIVANTFSITNRHPRPVSVTVLEPSPVSTSDEVKVRTTFEPKPSRETWQDKRGVVAWDLSLKPAETVRIKTDYEIEYPAEGSLIE